MASRQGNKILVILMAASLATAGTVTSGYAQEKQEVLQNPSAQRSPTTVDPGPSLRDSRARVLAVADVRVDPLLYSGICPATFTFNGKISVNRASTIYYRFVRSDNYRSQPPPLVFEEAGAQRVTHSWQVTKGTEETTEGWAAIQIVAPVKFQSDPAYFKNSCKDEPSAPPSGSPATEQSTQEQRAK